MATRPTTETSDSNRPGLTPVSLFLILLLFWIVTQVQLVLVLGLLALLFGTILEGPVRFFQERRFPRPAAILAVYIIIIGALVLLVVAIMPSITSQVSEFTDDVPGQLQELRDDWRASDNGLLNGVGADFVDRAIETIEGDESVNVSPDTFERAIPVLTSITGGVVATVTLLVMTFYYLLEKRLLRGLILDTLTPRFRSRVDTLWTEVESKVGRWMRGQLLLCLIIGTIATISYGVIGLQFWPLLGLWAGITEIIPIIGPWIGGVPAVLIALTMSWELAIITTLIIITMQSLENWILVPRVMKGAVGLTPLTVFVAILAGTQFMGVVGAVLAIPIAATIQVILTDLLERRASRDERMTARSGWRWMLSRSGIRDTDVDIDTDTERDAADGRSWTGAGAEEDGNTYVPQQESESYMATYGPDAPEDSAETPADTVSEPAPPDESTHPAMPETPAPPVEEDDTSSAFPAWPRPADKERPRPPSSTWPPLEQGRADRSRRSRRDSDE